MLEHLLVLAAGVALGALTGIVPGIHPNTVIFTSLPLYFSSDISLPIYMSFISGLSVSHTFHDFLPAIFLGTPEAESALSSLPGAMMALEGRGVEAFRLTVIGGVFSVIAAIIVSPLLVLFLADLYALLEPFMAYILAFFLAYLVFRSTTLSRSLVVAALSGALGALSFSMHVNHQFVLVPVFSGLFALPSIYHALDSGFRLPVQNSRKPSRDKGIKGGAVGMLAGLMAGVFPGLGAAVSTSFLSPLIDSREEFLAGMGGVNTSDIIVSFVALLLIGKSRSGASVALSSISRVGMRETAFLAGSSLVAVSLAAPLALTVSSGFVDTLQRFRIEPVLYAVLSVVLLSTFYLTGLPGLLVLATATFTGYAALVSGERACCMAVLMVPAIGFYLPFI